jgi:PKD repeat protein
MTTTRLSRWLLAGLASLTLVACIPIPVITVSPSPVVAGKEVSFDASETMISNVPEDNVGVSYDWDFGDGNSGDGKTVTHTYEKAGTYKVTLTVVDSAGREGRATEEVEVKAAGSVSSTDDKEDEKDSETD